MAEALQITAPIRRIAPDTIRLERLLDAPVDKVWRYLTEAGLREQWFMGGTDAKPDGDFELLNDHDNLSEDDVPYPEDYAPYKGKSWHEKVLRFEPPHLLVTTFQGLRVMAAIDTPGDHISEIGLLKSQIKDAVSSFLYEQTKRRPLVFPVVIEV